MQVRRMAGLPESSIGSLISGNIVVTNIRCRSTAAKLAAFMLLDPIDPSVKDDDYDVVAFFWE